MKTSHREGASTRTCVAHERQRSANRVRHTTAATSCAIPSNASSGGASPRMLISMGGFRFFTPPLRDNLGDDRNRDLGGSLRADVEADGAAHGFKARGRNAGLAEVLEDAKLLP